MKSISRLKITQLSKVELSKREQNHLVGGENCCMCGCAWEGKGGSSQADNSKANNGGGASGLFSPAGGEGTGSFG